MAPIFHPRRLVEEVEEGTILAPKFGAGGLMLCVTTDAASGAPLILRGTLWPERPRAGLLHRSPPIAGSGETPLVLVLDPRDAPEDQI